MLRLLTLAFVLFAGSAVAASNAPAPAPGKGSQQPQAKAGEAERSAGQDQRGTEQFPIFVKPIQPEPTKEAREAEAKDREEKASETGWMIGATVANSFFTVVLAFANLALWSETRRLRKLADQQAIDTGKSFDVASRSADAALASVRAYQNAERAWLGYVGVNSKRFESADPAGNVVRGVWLEVQWINGGRTPAVKCSAAASADLREPAQDVPVFNLPPGAPAVMTRLSTVAPGVGFTSIPYAFLAQEIDSLMNNQRRVFLYSRVEYEDTFFAGTVRHTEVCLEVKFAAIRDDGMPIFNYSPVGPQNSAS
jgi:hypothetical protein